jgi:hypothetical protein
MVLPQRVRPVISLDACSFSPEKRQLEKENVSQLAPNTALAHCRIVLLHIFALRLAYARAAYSVAALEGLDNGTTDVHRRTGVCESSANAGRRAPML